MNMRKCLRLIVALLAVPLFARDKTDVLVMKNGDRMTCEVKSLDAGTLYVSVDYIDGTISIDWLKVASIESNQLFVVKTEDGSVYSGGLRTSENPAGRLVRIQVVDSTAPETGVERSQITQLIGTSDKFWQRFNGMINFGFIYAKGNESTQYSLGSQTSYVREHWSAQASFDSTLSSSSSAGATTRNAWNANVRHQLPWNNWFYAGVADFLQSSEQGISLQSTLGGGVGRFFKNTNRASISVLGAGAWQNTQYHQSVVSANTENSAAALLYADAHFFQFSKNNLRLTATLLPVLSEPGRVRFNTNASYYVKIVSNLKWNLSFYGNWDSRPPPTFSGSDYGSSSGLTWTFGLK
jgi:hypothetical protein